MSKRRPTSELNHENWDKEDTGNDEDVRGEFQQAAPDELKKRVIKVAKRRSMNPNTPSPFSAFKGFETSNPRPTTTPNFSFVAEGMKNGHAGGEDIKEKETKPTEEIPASSATKSLDAFVKPSTSGMSQTSTSNINKPDNSEGSPDYYSHLKSLNLSMASWITKHLNDNPYCILLPVFRDYEKHLDNITKNYPISSSEDETPGAPETKEMLNTKVPTVEETKPPPKLFPSVTKSDSSPKSDTIAEPAAQKTPFFTSIASSPSSTTSSSSSSLMFKLPSSDSPNSETSNKSEKTLPASPKTEPSTLAKTPADSFFTPLAQTPATTETPSSFQTPALTTPSLFGNLKSGSFFGGKNTAGENKTFNPSSLTFSFGTTTAQSSDTSKSTFSSSVPAFGSTSAPVFTFGAGAKPAMGGFGSGTGGGLFGGPPTSGGSLFRVGSNSTQAAKKEEEESEDPPKVEFNPIKEEDAVYEVTCKVYVRKDSEYKDRGKGQLYIKKVAGGKSQLLARAATTTGQILLNVILNSSVTVSKPATGKNSVIIMCVPLPSEERPTPVLIRVKTEADADELMAKLEEYKQPRVEGEPDN